MVLFSISLFTLATFSQNQIDPSYKVYLGGLAAEPIPADTKTLHKAANLLTSGQTKVLIQWATNKDEKKAYAARLILLGSGETAYLPTLLEGIHSPNWLQAAVGFKAVQLHAKASWPILVRMAENGKPAAFVAIRCYVERGQPEFFRLSKHRNSKTRAEAMKYVDHRDRILQVLDDPVLAVRRAAVQRLVCFQDFNYKPYLSHRYPKVRELFAELLIGWKDHDLTPWLTLASDKSITMRKWALLHMSFIGMGWGKDSQILEAIQAVRDTLLKGPPELYKYAAMAARGWLLEWYRIREVWTPQQIAAAKAVFQLPSFRNSVYYQALSEGSVNGTTNIGALGINMRPALQGLIMSKDRRALPMATKLIDQEPAFHSYWIRTLAELPGPDTVDYIFRLIEKTAIKTSQVTDGAEDHLAKEVFQSAVWALRQLRVKDWSQAIACMNSPKISSPMQTALAYELLTHVSTDQIVQTVLKLASTQSIRKSQRDHLLFGMQYCPHPSIGDFLESAAKTEPDPAFRKTIYDYLEAWRLRFQKSKTL